MEPQEGEESQAAGHHHHHHHHSVLGGDVFEEGGPMSTMSDSGGAMAHSPGGAASDGSYASHSPDSLMGSSPVFNQRPKKRMKKVWDGISGLDIFILKRETGSKNVFFFFYLLL